ncbi:hypothetical protein [uncultured Eudoraea sp.]|uniref:hypothetical protein n=1 Tax=uncultured Eudoraea sp. TaxID=1035614 RepID=UPI002608B925|nr:hypothetical protein [uncultured Eudoraea sp.]
MQTYRVYFLLLSVILMGCSDDLNENKESIDDLPSVDANYSLIVKNNDILSLINLNADADNITLDPGISEFENISLPVISYREGKEISIYKSQTDCSGVISLYDFKNDGVRKTVVFDDLANCELIVLALAHSTNAIYIAYEVPGQGLKETGYYIRSIDTSNSEPEFVDIELEKKPMQAVYSEDRVFILTEDPEDDNKNAVIVLDTTTNELVVETNLGFEVQRIFKASESEIIIGYADQHTVINSTSMNVLKSVRYTEGKEPRFADSECYFYYEKDNLYYAMPTDLNGTSYPNIPAVYDFESNTAILYYYENFLTEQEQSNEFEIGNTSLVSYDSKNNLILIGYQKSEDPEKGGLLRIRPIPNPKFIDNIDLNGVPYQMYTD